jgi:hypothetical protein
LVAFLSIQQVRVSSLVLASPMPAAGKLIEKLGGDNAALLLRHAAAEQARYLEYKWEEAEMVLGVALFGCLFLGTQRRALPLVLCGIMLLLVAFQHFALTTEMTYRGRETDFPPGNTAVGPVTRLLLLQQVFFSVEIMKLVAGGILASFLFVYRTGRRGSRKNAPSTRDLDHSHVDG